MKMGKRKKYQLKYNDGTELVVIKSSDQLYGILDFINRMHPNDDVKYMSVWMNGEVLE